MQTYISMLRGINVSGQKRIKMDVLKAVYEAMGFDDVSTYIQSGNVIFKNPKKNRTTLSASIEKAINEQFAYPVLVMIREKDELGKIIRSNPFLSRSAIELDKLHVTFLSHKPDNKYLKEIENVKNGKDECQLSDKEIYLYCPEGYGRTKLTNNYFEKELGVSATTRNWKTVKKLYELAGNA